MSWKLKHLLSHVRNADKELGHRNYTRSKSASRWCIEFVYYLELQRAHIQRFDEPYMSVLDEDYIRSIKVHLR